MSAYELNPIDQTLFGDKNGNCFPACIATVLGIPLNEIPNFCVLYGDSEWYSAFALWLRPYGWAPLSFLFADEIAARNHLDWAREIAPAAPWLAAGETDRGKHCVVYKGAKLFHDPNPRHGRSGVTRVEDATYFIRLVSP